MTNTLVAAAMTPSPQTLDVDDPPSRVLQVFEHSGFHHLPVLEEGRLVGIVSTTDLARAALRTWVCDGITDGAWLDVTYRLSDIMSVNPVHVRSDQPLRDAAELLSVGTFYCLPVVDADQRLVGILTTTGLAGRLASDPNLGAEERTQTTGLAELGDELFVQAWLSRMEMLSPSKNGNQVRDEVLVLARIRDALRLQVHLGRMDATERWSQLEGDWQRLTNGGFRADATAALREANEDVRGVLGRIRSGYRLFRADAFHP